MNYLKERVAYLKGLAEGMQISDATNEGKLLKAIIDVLDDVALSVDDVEEVQEEFSEQLDEMDEDLADIESLIYGDECECDECEEDVDEDEEEDDEDEDEDDGDEEDEDDSVSEFECPHCGETIVLEDAFMKKDSILCPHCHNEIEIEWSCDCEECADSEEDSDK
ncbi:MAG: CD1247 N-terminal domain-containing protein [Clostridiaceae bacterium]